MCSAVTRAALETDEKRQHAGTLVLWRAPVGANRRKECVERGRGADRCAGLCLALEIEFCIGVQPCDSEQQALIMGVNGQIIKVHPIWAVGATKNLVWEKP